MDKNIVPKIINKFQNGRVQRYRKKKHDGKTNSIEGEQARVPNPANRCNKSIRRLRIKRRIS
jgi:hypothetical protein